MKPVLLECGRRFLVCAAVLCAILQQASAQVTEPRVGSRWALGVAADVGGLPDALSTRCDGSNGAPMVGAGLGILFASRPWLIMASDVRVSATPPIGCDLVLPAPVSLGGNRWESAVTRDYGNAPRPPLTRSAMRVGVQTPHGMPLIRATLGGGLLWSTRPAPFATATLGFGSRGSRVRFYSELEGDVARVRVFDERTFYHVDASGFSVIDSRALTASVIHPRWAAAHIGVELPLPSRRAGT